MSNAHIPPAVEEILFERKKNEEIKGLINNIRLILFYTLQLVIPNLCTKFIILSQVLAEKTLTENVQMHYIGLRDGNKKKIEKEDFNNK